MSSNDLSSKMSKIEQDIKELKTVQAMENDSYKIYTFVSDNYAFEGNTTKTVTGTFVPKINDEKKVLCQFYAVDLTLVQSLTYANVSTNNPLTCTTTAFGYASATPIEQRQAYLMCLANCDGELRVNIS